MRESKVTRKTKETAVEARINLDGTGKYEIQTGIGFFNHMLELFAYHGMFDLSIKCDGDIAVDGHHTVEDVGIVLGTLFSQALGDKKGIERYASTILPMDETLTLTAVDISGRPYFCMNTELEGVCGEFDAELVREFFTAFCAKSELALHVRVLEGGNLHHTIEGIFKSAARSLKAAVKVTGKEVPSTKGVL